MPSMIGAINAESCSADIYMRRWDMADLVRENPDDASLSKWLINLYKEKVVLESCSPSLVIKRMSSFLFEEQQCSFVLIPYCFPVPSSFLSHSQDDLVQYHNEHKTFPSTQLNLPKRPWADMVVLMWVCICSVPMILVTLYLAWFGKWLMLIVMISSMILGRHCYTSVLTFSSCLCKLPLLLSLSHPPPPSC